MHSVTEVIQARRSVKVYDPTIEISKKEVIELLELTSRAPSAWNLQQWQFKVCLSKESKEKLLPIAYNQTQVRDASAVVAILGDLEAYKNVEAVFGPAVQVGAMTEEIKNTLASQIEGTYKRNPQYGRDAAFSNASLAAMQLMLLAKERGWETCAMGGFHSDTFVKVFNISPRFVPVMLITIGKPLQEGRPTNRLPIELTTTFE